MRRNTSSRCIPRRYVDVLVPVIGLPPSGRPTDGTCVTSAVRRRIPSPIWPATPDPRSVGRRPTGDRGRWRAHPVPPAQRLRLGRHDPHDDVDGGGPRAAGPRRRGRERHPAPPEHRGCPSPPGVRLVSLASPLHPVKGVSRLALGRTRSALAHPNDRLGRYLTRAHDHWLRRYVAAQDDCVVVATRMSLNLALAGCAPTARSRWRRSTTTWPRRPRSGPRTSRPTRRLDGLVVLTEGDARRYRELLGTTCPVAVVPNALPTGIPLRRVTAHRDGRRLGRFPDPAQGLRPPRRRLARRRRRPPRLDAADLRHRGRGRRPGPPGRRRGARGHRHPRGVRARPRGPPRRGLPVRPALAARGDADGAARGDGGRAPRRRVRLPDGTRRRPRGWPAGVLVPPGDVPALAAGITRVLSDAAERHRLAAAGATRVRDFDPLATARRWESLFEELADRRGLSVGR